MRYTKEEDIKSLKLNNISEKFFGKDYNYLIGILSLTDLMNAKDALQNKGVYIVDTGKDLRLLKKEGAKKETHAHSFHNARA